MYSWIPAACIDQFSAVWFYFRYGKTGVKICEHKIFDDHAEVKLPDREILLSLTKVA